MRLNLSIQVSLVQTPKRLVIQCNFPVFYAPSKTVTGETTYQFSGLELQDLLVVEICAGTARLTKTVRARGIRGLAVDKSKSRTCGTDIMIWI